MKYFMTSLTIALWLSMSASASAKTAFIYMHDDSGVMQNSEQITEISNLLITQFKELRKRKRKYANAQFILISTSLARAVWYGTIADLSKDRASTFLEHIANKPNHCNELTKSFDAIKDQLIKLKMQGYTEIHISVLSNMISTPVPCKTLKIKLPQLPVPVDWQASLTPIKGVKSVTFYGIHANQYPIYMQSMMPLMKWAEESNTHFALHDIPSSEFVLRNGLEGVEK